MRIIPVGIVKIVRISHFLSLNSTPFYTSIYALNYKSINPTKLFTS